jgi:hypothetical protein
MKTDNQSTKRVLFTALGAWILTIATLVGSLQTVRQLRQPIISSMRPAFAYADNGENLYNRNDNENETVHSPTKFDVGLKITAISGKK